MQHLIRILIAVAIGLALTTPLAAQDFNPPPDAGDNGEAAGTGNGNAEPDAGNVPEPATPTAAFDKLTLASGATADADLKGFEKGKLQVGSGFGDMNVAPGDLSGITLKDERTLYLKRSKRDEARKITVYSADGALMYRDGDGEGQAFNWDDVFMMKTDPIPSEKWSGSIAATFSLGRGNTEDISAGINASLKRETLIDTLEFTYEFGYTETGTDPTTVSRRYHLATIQYRFFLDDAFNLFAKDTFRHDLLAGLEYRNTLDLGASWVAIKESDETRTLRFDASINHTFEKNVGVEATNYVGATAALDFMQKLGDSLQLLFFASISFDFDVTENWISTLRLTVKNDLGEGFTLSVVAQIDYDNQPAPGFRPADYRLTAILGWSF